MRHSGLFVACGLLLCLCSHAHARILFVDDDASNNGDGQSWPTAYRYLQDALDHARTIGGIEIIRVAQGVYKPDESESGIVASGDRNATFRLMNGVEVLGGFGGIFAQFPNARSIQYVSILSGDLAGNDIQLDEPDFNNNAENSLHVVTGGLHFVSGGDFVDPDRTAVLDGFVIRDGFSNGAGSGSYGAGMNIRGSPTVIACTIVANAAASLGGGAFNVFGSPMFHKCVFDHNVAVDNGGAICNFGSSPEISACEFIANESDQGGAIFGVSAVEGSGNPIFSHNSAISNCMFTLNSAHSRGGAIYASGLGSKPTIANCTFGENSSQSEGGAIYIQRIEVSMVNCVLWNNAAPWGPEVALKAPPCEVTVRHSNIMGGQQNIAIDPGATLIWDDGNIAADPLFEDVAAGDLRLSAGSPCIDTGDDEADINVNSTGIQPLPLADLEANTRIVDCHVDMGAYEFQGENILFGDFDDDCLIDLADYDIFEICSSLSGPGVDPIFEECRDIFDSDDDGDVDLFDFGVFQNHFSG